MVYYSLIYFQSQFTLINFTKSKNIINWHPLQQIKSPLSTTIQYYINGCVWQESISNKRCDH